MLTLCCLLKLFVLCIVLLLFHNLEQTEDQFCSVFWVFFGCSCFVVVVYWRGRSQFLDIREINTVVLIVED